MNPTKLIRSIFAKRLSQIDRYADYGDIIQQKTLLDLLQKAKNTEFGTKFKFNDISSYKSFAENIPINGYEELKPYIERTMSGEQISYGPHRYGILQNHRERPTIKANSFPSVPNPSDTAIIKEAAIV